MKRPGQTVSVLPPQKGTDHPALLVSLNFRTMERELTSTTYSWDGHSSSDVVHSASTANYSCGALLYDSKLKAFIGLHHGTHGPDSKNGSNNLCAPLKAMGLRQ
jgi:hypothetical protein